MLAAACSRVQVPGSDFTARPKKPPILRVHETFKFKLPLRHPIEVDAWRIPKEIDLSFILIRVFNVRLNLNYRFVEDQLIASFIGHTMNSDYTGCGRDEFEHVFDLQIKWDGQTML